jgi:hypothetical protein
LQPRDVGFAVNLPERPPPPDGGGSPEAFGCTVVAAEDADTSRYGPRDKLYLSGYLPGFPAHPVESLDTTDHHRAGRLSCFGEKMADSAPEQRSPPLSNKRRRIPLACNACRMRKSRCDGQRPSCSSCLGLGVVCLYEPTESAANIIVRKEYLSELDQRVAANERMLQRLDALLESHLSGYAEGLGCCDMNRSHPSVFPAAALANEESHHRANVLEEPRDEDASARGTAMTFIEEHTSAFFGESSNIHFARLLLHGTAAVRKSVRSQLLPADGEKEGPSIESNAVRSTQLCNTHSTESGDTSHAFITALPSTEEMDNLLDVYFDTCGVVFPFIHEDTTRRTYAQCKEVGFTKIRRTWLGTLNMMFAIASKHDLDGEDTSSTKSRVGRSDVFYQRAVGLCGELSQRIISLEIVHYLILIVIFCQGTKRSIQAWNLHGLLVRSALALGLHSSRTYEALDPSVQASSRRTWLVIYGLDKVLSMVYGRPSAILDEQPITSSLTGLLDGQTDIDPPGQFLAVSTQLYQLMGRSLIKQYGANMEIDSLQLEDLASLQASNEFRKLLQKWTLDLPSQLCLCEAGSDMLMQNTQTNRLRVILTLRYYNLCILVHKPLLSATLRHLFNISTSPDRTASYFVQAAMADAQECLHAAESTIQIVHAVMDGDATSSNNLGVWFFTLYYGMLRLRTATANGN